MPGPVNLSGEEGWVVACWRLVEEYRKHVRKPSFIWLIIRKECPHKGENLFPAFIARELNVSHTFHAISSFA